MTETKVTVRYVESAPLGPEPHTELPGNRAIRWEPGKEVTLEAADAARLLRSGGRAFEVVAAVQPTAADATEVKRKGRPKKEETR